jgi:hypothetical protein
MLLFRSEEEIDQWCARTNEPRGEIVPIRVVWELAQAWYSNRMNASYRGRTALEAEQILHDIGLASPFWRFS